MYFLLLSFCFLTGLVWADTCAWDSCPVWPNDPNHINIHFVPHTHDDMGWLKTVDDYYTGAHPEQVNVGVQYIINTVVNELAQNSSRKFSYCETGFLTRWLEDHDEATISKLVNLVKNGQLELIGGGWVQPDEAASHYIELIDMYTLGLRKLKQFFGDQCAKPRIGWQIDPFGHSREHANLLKLMGYEALYFAREDFREHINRRIQKRLEFYWYTSEDNADRSILTGVFADHYGPPSFLDFDIGNFKSVPVIDNPNLENFNVDDIVQKLRVDVNIRSYIQPHNHFLYLLGSDFHYSDANHYFSNMDRLIKYVNNNVNPRDVNMTIQYSTPSCYTQAIRASNTIKTNKTYDFFPYASDLHEYWTGYFTSKPAFKGLVRRSSSLLNTIRQISTFAKLPNVEEFTSPENKLERAVSLALHHDGITGTSKQFVTENYQQRIFKAYKPIQDLLQQSLVQMNHGQFPNQSFCVLMNETVCDFTNATTGNFAILLFNGNSQPTSQLVKIPIYRRISAITDSTNQSIFFNRVVTPFQVPNQINNANSAPFLLYFVAELPAHGFTTYFVQTAASESEVAMEAEKPVSPTFNAALNNGLLLVTFDENNKMKSVKDFTSGITYNLSQDLFFYEGHDDSDGKPSGAYIFRPQNDTATMITGKPDLTMLGFEARQVFSDYASQTIRLIPEKRFIEFEWTIGPLPKVYRNSKMYGKEVITRYMIPDIQNKGVLFTDANGRQLIRRKVWNNPDFTFGGDELVAGNYFPVTNKAIIQDNSSTMVVLTDRSQGVTSPLFDNYLEFMLHRRDCYDDGFGVREPLDEPGKDGRGLVVRGIHRLFIGDTPSATRFHRTAAFELYHQPVISFVPVANIGDYQQRYLTSFTGLAVSLPENVQVLTLKQLSPGKILLRLEHIFAKNEDPSLSQPVTLNLGLLFNNLTIVAVQELSLGANSEIQGSTSTTVTLNPQEIKTFQLTIQ